MSDMSNASHRQFRARHRGRGAQVGIYLGKLLRMFIYQNDWKVLPMSALIAGLVGMVIRRKMFLNMEGTIMGSFALVCVCIWNGCFNSIQVICRERDVIKREHRSGMHISSYIFSHMVYQCLLCLMQTGVTLYVTRLAGVKYDMGTPMFTPWYIVDLGISMLMITYASDMMSLWVSTLAHTTTTAMTIMPFVLIFQLVFSGGMLTLPTWTKPLTHFTISNPGLKVISAQADTNNRPFVTISDMIVKMRDNEISTTITLGQALDLLQDVNNPTIEELRKKELGKAFTLGEAWDFLQNTDAFSKLKAQPVLQDLTVGEFLKEVFAAEEMKPILDQESGVPGVTLGTILSQWLESPEAATLADRKLLNLTTVGDLLDIINAEGIVAQNREVSIDAHTTVGEAVDWLAAKPDVQSRRDASHTFSARLGEIIDMIGEEKVKTFLEEKAAAASYKPEYAYTADNITDYWLHLFAFIAAFALLSTITLEFIDKDKR